MNAQLHDSLLPHMDVHNLQRNKLIWCAGKGDEGSSEDSEEDAEAGKQVGSAGQVAIDKTPVGMLQSHVGCLESSH